MIAPAAWIFQAGGGSGPVGGEIDAGAMTKPPEPKPGLYHRNKGNNRRVTGRARHSEALEPMVMYQALYSERDLWVRPAAMFSETAKVAGRRVPRFARVAD